jgi:preprotein translocase subunit SecF
LQFSGDQSIIIKLPFISEAEHQKILLGLRDQFQKDTVQVREERLETIGPAFSEQLKTRSPLCYFGRIYWYCALYCLCLS